MPSKFSLSAILSVQSVPTALVDATAGHWSQRHINKDLEQGQAKVAELFQQIFRPRMELEWLKKVTNALMPLNWRTGLLHDQPHISVRRQRVLLGLLQSTLYYRPN
jgi:putative transposase